MMMAEIHPARQGEKKPPPPEGRYTPVRARGTKSPAPPQGPPFPQREIQKKLFPTGFSPSKG